MKQHILSGGFTLPEMMITLGLVAIVLSTAVPSINSTIKDNRLVTHLNSVITDIHFARSEAAKRDTRVILCRSPLPVAGSPVCGGSEREWSTGYIIFADDGNYTNNVYDAGQDTLLKIGMAAAPGLRVRTSSSWNKNLEFNPDGSTNEGGAVAVMSICDDRGEPDGRQIQIAPNGIPRMIAKDISNCRPWW